MAVMVLRFSLFRGRERYPKTGTFRALAVSQIAGRGLVHSNLRVLGDLECIVNFQP